MDDDRARTQVSIRSRVPGTDSVKGRRLARGDRVAVGLVVAIVLVLGFMAFGYRTMNEVAANAQQLESKTFSQFQQADELRSLQQESALVMAR